jgi:hypothetical protein
MINKVLESYFFFQAPDNYDEAFLKKAVKEGTAELMRTLIEKLIDTDLKVNFWHLEHFVNLAA